MRREEAARATAKTMAEQRAAGELPKHRPVWTRAEVREQEEFAYQMWLYGTSYARSVDVIRKRFRVSKMRATSLLRRVEQSIAPLDQKRRDGEREQAVQRIKILLTQVRGRRTDDGLAWKEKPNHSAIARYEDQLAKLMGLNAPVQIDLNVQVSAICMNVMANMTGEEVQDALDEFRRKEQLAEEYERLLAAKTVAST